MLLTNYVYNKHLKNDMFKQVLCFVICKQTIQLYVYKTFVQLSSWGNFATFTS